LRNLKVACVERDDFAAGTSSRSTKLIHGGVRYLEKAFFQMDPAQLKLVFEALSERSIMLHQAPHLSHPLPTILPCYKYWEVPFYWIGLKAYDFVAFAGNGVLFLSKFASASEARRLFPTLAETSLGRKLRGSIIYYDGQMNDARFNISLALTAAMHGAVVANHTEAVELVKNDDGKVAGAVVRDGFTGKQFPVRAKVVVNATGPFTDGLREKDEPTANKMIVPSSGVHITLPEYYSAEGFGLIVPKTKDGRVVFMLPWLGSTIAGTTDSSTEITALPQPHEDEVGFILDALSDYLNVDVRRKDVKSAWSGIRPLAIDPDRADDGGTQNILREHAVHVSPNNLVTITGGKWTTYRKMAEDGLDKAIEVGDLKTPAPCRTEHVQLIGAHKWDPAYFTFLTQHYEQEQTVGKLTTRGPLDVDVAKHLTESYGDQSYKVAEIAQDGHGHRLAHGFPVIEAEVLYCIRNEYCCTIEDFIARRSRLAFLDARATEDALPRIADLMASELQWSSRRKRQELDRARRFIGTFSSGKS